MVAKALPLLFKDNKMPITTSPVPPVISGTNAPETMGTPATGGNILDVINPNQAVDENIAKQKAGYDAAVDTRDKSKLADVYQSDPSSPVAQAALDALNHIGKEEKAFTSVLDPIEKAGGPGTPGGNIAAAQQFGFHPKYGSAIVAYLMGQKEAAYNLATGGQEKESVEFGKDGGRFYRTTNALGQTIKVKDSDGNDLTPSQVQDLGIGYSSYESTQKAKNEALTKTDRQKESNLDTKSNNTWYTFVDTSAKQTAPSLLAFQKAKGQLAPKVYAELLGIVSKGTNVTGGNSSNTQNIGTKSGNTVTHEKKGGGANVGGTVGGEVSPIGNVGGKLNANAETGSSTTVSGTDQNLTGTSSRSERENTLQQNRQSLAAKLQATQLSATDQAEFLRAFDSLAQIKQSEQDLLSDPKIKKPNFISLINKTQLGDQQSQVESQILQILHNNEQMKAYLPYYNKAMESFRKTGTSPDFGEIEAAFTNTKDHGAISNKYSNLIGQVIHRNAQNAEQATQQTINENNSIPDVAKPPPVNSAIPITKTKNGAVAPPRLSLDMIGKLYANQLKKS
jgi:hypothetical protein